MHSKICSTVSNWLVSLSPQIPPLTTYCLSVANQPEGQGGQRFLIVAGVDYARLRSFHHEVASENRFDVIPKFWLEAGAGVVWKPGILEGAGKQKKVPTTNSGTSDVLSEDWSKVFREAVEATAVDQAKRRFQPQPFLAKVDDFKRGRFRLAGGQATAVLDRHTAKVEPQNRKTLISQPPADLTATTAQVDDALTFREPARVDRFDQLLLRLLRFPEGSIFRVGPPALPSAAMSLARPIGKVLFNPLLYPM